MSHELILHGCTPTPLASYLKALAVLRLTAEQSNDPNVTGCWRGDQFVLHSQLTGQELSRFFLEDYKPTPLIAPWNGGSGFYARDNKDGFEPLVSSTSERFRQYRASIQTGQTTIASFSLKESPKQEQKAAFLQRLRNQAPDPLLRWMDAAVILSDDDPAIRPCLALGATMAA
jgi:CRISPR-associated protein Csx17